MNPITKQLSAEEQAINLISPIKFHQIFTIPATDSHGPLKVTYAIVGPQYGEVPTVLFIGGMFGTRWMGVGLNSLAEKEGVRILFIDRPGLGGSTPVPIHLRLSVFMETVPLLLAHLKIPNLSLLASHSSGTIFALNTLQHLPHLLSPTSPRVMLFAPWVHQSISSVSFLKAAALLPNPLLDRWNGLIGFIVNSALPNPIVSSSVGAIGASSGLLNSVGNLCTGSERKSKEEKTSKLEAEKKKFVEVNGYEMDMKNQIGETIMKYAFAENTTGGNDEARLCLKSIPNIDWDACESLPELVTQLKEAWAKKVEQGSFAKLKVQLVFGESDVMIGVKGRRYFEDCWTKEELGEGIEVRIMEVEGGDHESVIDPMKSAIPKLMSDAKN